MKDNKELLFAIANFVCCKDCKSVEFVELFSHDELEKMYIILILLVDDDKIAVQFVV